MKTAAKAGGHRVRQLATKGSGRPQASTEARHTTVQCSPPGLLSKLYCACVVQPGAWPSKVQWLTRRNGNGP